MGVEVRLKLRHHGCYSESLTADAKVIHWSGDGVACLSQVHGSRDEQARIIASMAQWVDGGVEVFEQTDSVAMIRCACPRRGLTPRIGEAGASVVWPVVHADGHEYWQLLASSRDNMDRVLTFLRTVGDVEVLFVGDAEAGEPPSALRHFLEDMTPRQLTALQLAWARGYYDRPRRTSVEDLAEEAGVSPSTFQEHLQKAQRQVVAGFAALLAEDPSAVHRARRRRGRPRQ